jgi:hypothetical protein
MKILIKGIPWRTLALRSIWLWLASIALAITTFFHLQQAAALKAAQQMYSAQLSVNRGASDALDELNVYLKPYQQWVNHGLIGDPRRLAWLEALKRISIRYQVPRIEFELQSSRMTGPTDSSYFRESIAMTQTPMMLTMRLAHEMDFVNLLSDLKREGKGLFDIKECVFNHYPKGNRLNPEVSLLATCEIIWYSLADITKDWQAYNQGQL